MGKHLARIGSFVLAAPFLVIGYLAGVAWIAMYCGFKWAEIALVDDTTQHPEGGDGR